MQGRLRDDQWEMLAPLLPPARATGRPRADDWPTLEGILRALRSGARWKDLPREFGSSSTCHRRLQRWQRAGTWQAVWQALLRSLNEQGRLDWSETFLDGSFVPAKKEEPT